MNIKGHLKTVLTHKKLVMHYCFQMGLYKQGICHDLSKFSPTEFIPGCIYYQGNRSPNNAEREKNGLSKAWLHHKGRNKHHFEYWIDYSLDKEKILEGGRIPRRYVAEMVADMISASRTYNMGHYNDSMPLEYFMRGAKKLWFIHPESKRELEGLLRMNSEKGERYTTRYIRNHYLRGGMKDE